MNKTILLLTLITTINLTASSFSQMRPNINVAESQISQKYFYAKRAAQRGNARAMFDLGLMYANGDGVEKNEALALMWFTKASKNNFSNVKVVQKVTKTEGTSQKFVFAQRAAAKGNARAQYDLGVMYAKGDGVEKNEALAFKYFHKAARNNIVEAKFQMGLNFAEGRGVRKQTQLAKYWFKLAAKAGHSKAMAHLATLENRNRIYGQNRRVAFLSSISATREF